MKYSSIIITTLFSILTLCNCSYISKTKENLKEKKPLLTSIKFLNSKSYNFGNVKQDTIISRKYIFKNTGQNPLLLTLRKISCNCTKSNFSKKIINPNDTAHIKLDLNTKNKYNYTNIYCVFTCNTKQKYYKISMNGSIIN